MSARAMVLVLGVVSYLLAAWVLAGCVVAVPIGEGGRYGTVRCAVAYVPPIDLWQPAATFLPDK